MPLIGEIMQTRPAHEWLEMLTAAGIPCGPIKSVGNALADPHVAARRMIVELEHPMLGTLKSLATPVHLSANAITYRHHPPQLGEQNEEILGEIGYNTTEIEVFRSQGII